MAEQHHPAGAQSGLGDHVSPRATAVLVHGGWHGPWCWDPVRPGLHEAGIDTFPVELPMRNLAGDIQVVRDAVAEARKATVPVIAVGHSYGGQVINSAAHGADQLVYVAAMVPERGQSLLGAFGDGLTALPGLRVEGHSIRATEAAAPSFYGRCDPTTRDWALPRLRPIGLACLTETDDSEPAWKARPARYVVSADDRVLPVGYQRARAALMTDSVELDADHSPFGSATDALVDAIATFIQAD